MKKIFLITGIAVFLVICSTGMQAQTAGSDLNQQRLMLQMNGKWQRVQSPDSIDIWEVRSYWKALEFEHYWSIKNTKVPREKGFYAFDPLTGKIKGLQVSPNGNFQSSLILFTSEKIQIIDIVKDFNPAPVYDKYGIEFVTPDELIMFKSDLGGVKRIFELKYKNIQAQTTRKTLNQVELHKYFIGNWKIKTAKDTTVFWNVNSFGTGLEGYFKCVTKGEIFMERKQIMGYDNRTDKFIMSDMVKGMNIEIYSTWFTSENICEMVPFQYILNPEIAPSRKEMEIKSPDMFIYKTIVNNNIVKTDTYIRVK